MEARGATFDAVPVAGAATAPDERLSALVKRYVYASTAVFLVAGALGVVMRQSQADIARVGDNPFYAMMTAHGLGAFMAWGAFSIMGLGLWVLHSAGMEMRPLGYRLASATWWTTVAGTAGIIATTLFMGFAGSWVFLYPLPFFGAGEWGEAATALFSASVLLVGIGILTWCGSILHTVVGPANPARGSGVFDRLAVGMGMGIIFKRLLASPDRGIHYAVIPLTVIALDMIVATLPLAALLVVMIIESIDSSVSVDPLLAKNMLWFFGHPVVYLLLFPAVASYYLLIPRYAKRPLAAANVIAIAWLIAVVANVIIWAHHIYVDYPQGSFQSVINVAMEPLTFSITLVSALSLYSLTATMWRSEFEWTPASKFLVAGMIGWLTAGLSGVVNATIALDVDIHNTLWIVGHFHHMALLNIGLAIFGTIYAFLPELTRREWYSRKLGDWHLWLTVIGGYGTFIPWYIEGLAGAPRRYAVLPDGYTDAFALIALPFVLLTAIGQLVFAYNLVQTMRGRRRQHDDQPLLADSRQVSLVSTTVIVALIVPGFIVALDRIPDREPVSATAAQPVDEKAKPLPAGPGKELFVQTCGSCHTLAAAGTTGTVGPTLEAVPDERTVLNAIGKGGLGSGRMPAGLLEGKEAEQVAEFVAAAAAR